MENGNVSMFVAPRRSTRRTECFPYHGCVAIAGTTPTGVTERASPWQDEGDAARTQAEWNELVVQLARQQADSYLREPLELLSHANSEAGALDGYRGRQILELLQNADDAGDGFKDPRFLLRITRKGLVAANTGQAFSERGVKSLVISHASPKQLAQNRFIGCKGLGFRSVLTWSRAPVVLSGRLRIGFGAEHAENAIRSLMSQSGALAAEVERHVNRFGRLPVPILRFPHWAAKEAVDQLDIEPLLNAGYQTAIGLPFPTGTEGDRAYSEALCQLKGLAPESLLFCRNLEWLEFDGDLVVKWEVARERIHSGSDRVLISVSDRPWLWTVHRRTGQVPEDALPAATNVSRDFELAVAVPAAPADTQDAALCVFFPTQERLPIQVRMHATLELTENRNRLIDHASNRYVLRSLGRLFAETIEAEASQHGGGRAVELIYGLQDADPELANLGFREACVTELAARRILPRVGGDPSRPENARKPPDDVWLSILDPAFFPELLSAEASKLTGLLALFRVGWYEPAELTARLQQQLSAAAPADAGSTVGRLLARQKMSGVKIGDLLLDTEGRFVGSEDRCFLYPAAGVGLLDVPSWAASVRFLNPSFQTALARAAGGLSVRVLSDRLSQLGAIVEEYRLDTVARALIAQVSIGLDKSDHEQLQLRWKELLAWLYRASGDNREMLSRLPIHVIGKEGDLNLADKMYLGAGYPKGRVLERLYGSREEVRFVGSPDAIGLAGHSPLEVQSFLLALGVLARPRSGPLEGDWGGKYRTFMLDSQSFPVAVRGIVCESAADIRSACRDFDVRELGVPERLPAVLAASDPAAVAAFFLGDGSHLLANELAEDATFYASISREWSRKPEPNVRVPNAVLWLLRAVAWIPCPDGMRRRPREIILSESGARLFAGVFWKHSIDVGDPLLRECGGADALTGLLMRLGAVASLEDVSDETLYGLLSRLPESDPSGEAARRIYSTLVDSQMKPGDSASRARFLATGRVWCRSGVYLPVPTARYNSNLALPAAVEHELALIDIPRRRSGKVIDAIFGVGTLQSHEVSLELNLDETEFDGSSEAANDALRRALPYIYALRLHRRADEDGREQSLLSRINVRVCERAAVIAMLPDGKSRQLQFEEKGQRIAIGTDLYVVGEYDPDAQSVGRFWQWVASLISEVLGTDVAAEVGLVLRCRNPEEMADVVCDLIGEAGELKLAEARARIAEPAPTTPQAYPLPAPAEPAGIESLKEQLSGGDQNVDPDQNAAAPASGQSGTGEFVVEPGEAPSGRKPSPRRLVVAPGPVDGTGSRSGPVAPETVTFRIVEAFEQLSDPPRYPIRVSHVRGLEGLGCDYVSVGSEEIRSAIMAAGKVEDSDILRYIEVKGSSAKAGKIELEGHERHRAEQAGARYFVYRVFVDVATPNKYEIGVLSDPLKSELVQFVPRVSLAEGSGSEWFRISEMDEQEGSGASD
jgi:hypothetical protein